MAQPETDDLMNVDADALRALVRREREMNQRLQNEARQVAATPKKRAPPPYQSPTGKRARATPVKPKPVEPRPMTLAATPVAAGEAKDDQASEGDDDDWANWVREHLLAIMLTALAEGQTVTSALQTVQVQAWRLTSEVNPDDMAMFVQTTSSLLQSITEHVQQGTLLVEVQHFLDIANEAHRVSKSFTTMSAVSQLRLLQRALVQQLIEKGPDEITEDWTVEGCLSVRELRDLCQGLETEYRTKASAVQAAAQPAPLPLQPAWTQEQLEKVRDQRVTEKSKQIFKALPELTSDPQIHSFLIWILRAGELMLKLDASRFKEIRDQRLWQDMTDQLALVIPRQYSSFLQGSQNSTPVEVLHTLMRKITSSMVEEAMVHMKQHLSTMTQGSFGAWRTTPKIWLLLTASPPSKI